MPAQNKEIDRKERFIIVHGNHYYSGNRSWSRDIFGAETFSEKEVAEDRLTNSFDFDNNRENCKIIKICVTAELLEE